MQNIKKFISILNWVEPKFTIGELEDIKLKNDDIFFNSVFKSEKRQNDLNAIYESVEKALTAGFNIMCSTSQEYPRQLKQVFNCPVPLMYKGEFNQNSFNIGIVGSRRPQLSTADWLKSELYETLRELSQNKQNVNVYSGGAYGVDQMAHKVSLLASMPTTCFMPTGVNSCYPKSLAPLIDSIIGNGGAIVSPFPPDYPIFKSNFYFRNKILVILSKLIFIAEARRRSGTIMTANMAIGSGKSIVVLPQAPIKNCLGSLDLMDSGVPMIKCKKDLMYTISELSF